MGDFNATAFCDSTSDDTGTFLCSINDDVTSAKAGLDTFFLLFGGGLVFMMQAGFAMLCAGSVRQKNAMNIMLKNLLDACGGAIGFYCIGFAVAYGGDQSGPTFIGNGNFALMDYAQTEGEEGYAYATFFFQFAFAATAATIVAGTVAERCKMSAYLCYSVFLSSFVYPVVAHAVWDDNGYFSAFAGDEDDLLRGVGCIDFAGSGVVHMTGGLTALIAAIVLGPRKGRFYDEDGRPLETPKPMGPHSVSLQILGTFILWFGWYGFNPASALFISSSGYGAVAALCAVTTTMAAACGCVSSMFLDSIIEAARTGHTSYDLTCAMNGALGGLVAITAGTSVVTPWAACAIGAIGGVVYLMFSKLLISLRIDDAVDAIPVHFANGAWGVIAVGLFANKDDMARAGYNADHQGFFYELYDGSSSANLLLVQVITMGSTMLWVLVCMAPFFILLNCLGMFRVDDIDEDVGLDISHHRGAAYDLSPPKEDAIHALNESRHRGRSPMVLPESATAFPPPEKKPLPQSTPYYDLDDAEA